MRASRVSFRSTVPGAPTCVPVSSCVFACREPDCPIRGVPAEPADRWCELCGGVEGIADGGLRAVVLSRREAAARWTRGGR